MIERYLDTRGKDGIVGFMLNFVIISIVSVILSKLTFDGLHSNHHYFGLSIFFCILFAVIGLTVFAMRAIRRLNDMAWSPIYSLLMIFPAAMVTIIALYVTGVISDLSSVLSVVVIALGVLVMLPMCIKGSAR